MKEEEKENITRDNPFTRKNRNFNNKNDSGSGAAKEKVKTKTNLFGISRRDPAEARASVYHQLKVIKLRTIPFFKSLLCFDFFARLVIFIGFAKFLQY